LAASSAPQLTDSKPASPPSCRLDVILNAKWNEMTDSGVSGKGQAISFLKYAIIFIKLLSATFKNFQ